MDRRLAFLLPFLPGCAEPRLQSPLPEEVLRADWAPLIAALPREWRDATVRVEIDGQPADDPLGVIRKRKGSEHERGAQYIASLDLTALEPGAHTVAVEFRRPWRLPARVEGRFSVAPRPLRLQVVVHDPAGRPLDARVLVLGPDGPVQATDVVGWRSDPKHRDAALDAFFTARGAASLRLDPGRYRLLALRDPRDEVASAEVELVEDTSIELTLSRAVETPGQISADLHVHTCLSYDAYSPLRQRALDLASSGLDAAVIADHNRIAAPAALQEALGGPSASPLLIAGIEADVRSHAKKNWDVAHLVVWPVAGPAAPPTRWPRTVAHGITSWRRRQTRHPTPQTGADLQLTLAHPRGILFKPGARSKDQAWALFNNQGYTRELPVGEAGNAWMTEPDDAGSTALSFDAIEVVNRMGFAKYREVRADWFALLSQGLGMTAVAGSDSHALAIERAGWPRNLVAGALDAEGRPSAAALYEAVRAGRVTVTTGPVVELSLRNERGAEAGPGALLDARGGHVRAELRVRAASWVPVPELRLVQDGEVLHKVALDAPGTLGGPALDHRETLDLPVTRDGWVLLEAGWPLEREDAVPSGDYALLLPGYVPLAFTNPVRLDADGDRAWKPSLTP